MLEVPGSNLDRVIRYFIEIFFAIPQHHQAYIRRGRHNLLQDPCLFAFHAYLTSHLDTM
jgi:hypothetical protein